MIDYDKLKIAHELAEKYYNQSGDSIVIEHNCCFGCYVNVPCQMIINQVPHIFNSLDNLIDKLTELTQPTCKCGNKVYVARSVCNECIDRAVRSCKPRPKYEVGQTVWWLEMGAEIHSFKIQHIFFNEVCEWEYDNIPETELYPSREALIDAQIKYWKGLSAITDGHKPVVCQHESDGKSYYPMGGIMHIAESYIDGCILNCKKCGEFYR
jgi:hypothetical protein